MFIVLVHHVLILISVSLLIFDCDAYPDLAKVGRRDAEDSNQTFRHYQGRQRSSDDHVVLLKKQALHARHFLKRMNITSEHADIIHVFDNPVFDGFTARVKPHCVHALRGMADVARVEKSVTVRTNALATRPNVYYNLQRISSVSPLVQTNDGDSTFNYNYYDDPEPGKGVDIYIVDTGINFSHEEFTGRASMAFSSHNLSSVDDNGHGTNVAGIAGGAQYGVASNATLLGVKVFNANDTGDSVSIFEGLDFVASNHGKRVKSPDFVGSVINLSLGTKELLRALGIVLGMMSEAGMHTSVAAGNDWGADACRVAPACFGGNHSTSIVTVGAVDLDGSISSFSNTGPCIDLYAPGRDIRGPSNHDNTSLVSWSGTSQATPHASGVMAYLLAKYPAFKFDTVALKATLLASAQPGIVHTSAKNITAGDRALLLNNGVNGSAVDYLSQILPSRSLLGSNGPRRNLPRFRTPKRVKGHSAKVAASGIRSKFM